MNKKIFILLLVLALLAGCSTPQQKPAESKSSSIFETEDIKNVRIKTDNLNVRSGCGNNFRSLGQLDKGDTADVIGKYKDWYIIQLPGNKNQIGCVPADDAKPIVEEGQNKEEQTKQVTPASRLTQNEQRMVTLINQERRKNNIKPLNVDLEVTKVARIKSKDMVDKNYFSHYSPTYGSPFDMMKSFGIDYVSAGENIAANSTVDRAHNSLMNSKGHRENILNPNFTHVGIGIVDSDKYGLMFTQMFISKPK